jgi:hypothetical protein
MPTKPQLSLSPPALPHPLPHPPTHTHTNTHPTPPPPHLGLEPLHILLAGPLTGAVGVVRCSRQLGAGRQQQHLARPHQEEAVAGRPAGGRHDLAGAVAHRVAGVHDRCQVLVAQHLWVVGVSPSGQV